MDRNVEILVMESMKYLADMSPEAPTLPNSIMKKGYFVALYESPLGVFGNGIGVLIDLTKSVKRMGIDAFDIHTYSLAERFRKYDENHEWKHC